MREIEKMLFELQDTEYGDFHSKLVPQLERNKIIQRVKELYPDEDIEVIDSFFENAPHDAKPLWFLGKSLELLSTADIAYFANGWEEYRGCSIEHKCAMEYGINIMRD